MSEESPALQDAKSLAGPPEKPRHLLLLITVVVALLYGFVSDTREILKDIKLSQGLSAAAADIPGMFSIPNEIFAEFDACNYEYLFFCELKSGVEKCHSRAANESRWEMCVAIAGSPDFDAPAVSPHWWQSVPVVNLAVGAAVLLPRLPDAVLQMLKVRWSQGSLEFQQGLLFLLAYITLLTVAIRAKDSANLWYFIVALVYGPYLIIGIFWLLQHALAGASLKVALFTGETTAGAGTVTCLAICVWHDLKSIREEVKLIGKAKLLRNL